MVFGGTGRIFRLNGRNDKKNHQRGVGLKDPIAYPCHPSLLSSGLRSGTFLSEEMKKLL